MIKKRYDIVKGNTKINYIFLYINFKLMIFLVLIFNFLY